MGKDRFLSTSSHTPLQSADLGGRQNIINLASKSVDLATDKFNARMQEFEAKSREAEQKGLLSAEKKRQLELAIPEAARQLQRNKLNTLNIVLGLKESIRKQEESKEASAYRNAVTSEAKLQFLQALPKIRRSAGASGEGLLTSVKAWWDKKETEIVGGAPSELAKLSAQEAITPLIENSWFDAIETEGKLKAQALEGSIKESENSLINRAITAPEHYDTVKQDFVGVAAVMKQAGFSDDLILQRKKAFDNKLLEETFGILSQNIHAEPGKHGNKIETLSKMFHNEVATSSLDPNTTEKLTKQYARAKMSQASYTEKQNMAGQAMDAIRQGKADSSNKSHVAAVTSMFQQNSQRIESTISSISDPRQAAAMYTAEKTGFATSAAFIPDSEINRIEMALKMPQSPERAVAEAQYLMNIKNNKSTINKFKGFSNDAIIRAEMLTAMTAQDGLTPKVALENLSEILNQQHNPAVTDAREKVWDKQINSNTAEISSELNDLITGSAENLIDEFIFADEADTWYGFTEVPELELEQYKQQFISVAKDVYVKLGDEKRTLAVAKSIMKQRLGLEQTADSLTDTEFELSYNPPSNFFAGESREYFDSIRDRALSKVAPGRSADEFKMIYAGMYGDKVQYKLWDKDNNKFVTDPDNLDSDAILTASMRAGKEYSLLAQRTELMQNEKLEMVGALTKEYKSMADKFGSGNIPGAVLKAMVKDAEKGYVIQEKRLMADLQTVQDTIKNTDSIYQKRRWKRRRAIIVNKLRKIKALDKIKEEKITNVNKQLEVL